MTRDKRKKQREDRNLLLEENHDDTCSYQSLPPVESVVDQPVPESFDIMYVIISISSVLTVFNSEKTLLQPEIPGLWEKRDINNENDKKETHKQSKMEKV